MNKPNILLCSCNDKQALSRADQIYTIAIGDLPYERLEFFVPTWELVGGYKHYSMPNDPRWYQYQAVTKEEYRKRYLILLQKRFLNISWWLSSLESEKLYALVCFCKSSAPFCHRHSVAEYLQDHANITCL